MGPDPSRWGLARNASFIVAPRDLTRGVDLDGRAFLHSYDPEADDDGSVLETILTAPMVVGHWINAQYYFSTVDPDHFGAGDKTLHNPVAGIGVLEGSGGDLRVGLPWQSVGHGTEPYHEPVRLLTVVEAPIERIEAVIARNTILQQLLDGAWVHLVARDPAGGTWMRRAPGGTWSPEPTEANPAPGKKETQP
ncbi:MAG: putative inorganic carbon transporter subunit DabA [Microthrixaceae bacterium]